MIEAINRFAELGLSPIPVFPSDYPDRPKPTVSQWKQCQNHIPTMREISPLFPDDIGYLIAWKANDLRVSTGPHPARLRYGI